MEKPTSAAMCVIPFATSELLWFWDVNTDSLWLSHGAQEALALHFEENTPISMSEFHAHVPPASLPAINEMREGVLNGSAGSRLEIVYPFDAFQIQEFMLVLARASTGRAIRVVGHYVITKTEQSILPDSPKIDCAATHGMWVFFRETGMVYQDAGCNSLIGLPAVPTQHTRGLCHDRLHPDDRERVTQSFALLADQNSLNDTVEHVVRIISGNTTELMRIRGSVLQRDSDGNGIMIAGTLQKEDKSKHHDLTFQDSRRLLFAVNSTGDGLWDWDATTDSVYFSPRYLSMLGYTADEFPPDLDVWSTKIHPDDHDKIVGPQAAIVESPMYGETFECTYRLLRKDGTYAWILGRGYVTHRDENGRATRLVGMHTDITTVQTEREQLEDLVKNDILTGLRSRTFCNLEIERIERNHIRPLCVFSSDINGLKLINDTLGHAAGDNLLRISAMLMRTWLRATDCVARMGGDEFVVLLPGCAKEKGESLLQQIRECFLDYNVTGENEVPTRAAFGMACTDDVNVSVSTLLRLADAAMMEEKNRDRLKNQRFIKEWIEEHTGKTVNIQDCRLLG